MAKDAVMNAASTCTDRVLETVTLKAVVLSLPLLSVRREEQG